MRPDLYDEYDAVALLDLPDRGRAVDPVSVRTALAELFAEEPEPRPGWLDPRRALATVSGNHGPQNGDPSSRGSWTVARFSNRVSLFRNVSLIVPVGPFRFLAMITSATPGWSLAIVVLGAMQEKHDVGILLDRTGFAKIGHPGPFVFPAFDRPIQL